MPPAVSRRSRPAKPELTLEGIVETTLALVDEHGMDAVSLRRVAQALDTGPASLYVYVADRAELFALVHDRVLGEIELTTEGDWRSRLITLLERSVAVTGRHGGIAKVALGHVPTGPNAMRRAEEMLALLREGGVEDQACAFAVDLFGLIVAAAGYEEWVYHSPEWQGRSEATEVARIEATYAAADPQRFPTIAALAPLLTRGGGAERLRWAFEVLVDGLPRVR